MLGSKSLLTPLRLETINVRNGPGPVPRKPSPESSVPCTIDSGRIPRFRRVPPSTYKKPLDLELTSRCILIKTYEAEYQRRFQHGI